jgi:hypothetical protein
MNVSSTDASCTELNHGFRRRAPPLTTAQPASSSEPAPQASIRGVKQISVAIVVDGIFADGIFADSVFADRAFADSIFSDGISRAGVGSTVDGRRGVRHVLSDCPAAIIVVVVP